MDSSRLREARTFRMEGGSEWDGSRLGTNKHSHGGCPCGRVVGVWEEAGISRVMLGTASYAQRRKDMVAQRTLFLMFYFILREREGERERKGEGQRKRETEDAKRALCWWQRSQCGALTYEL